MQPKRSLIHSFRIYLLTAAASLTLFLPAAISMNTITPSPPREEFGPSASLAALQNDIHQAPLRKINGRLALQTAAIVGSSAAVAAAKAAADENAAMTGRRFPH